MKEGGVIDEFTAHRYQKALCKHYPWVKIWFKITAAKLRKSPGSKK